MSTPLIALTASSLLLLAGCAVSSAEAFTMGDPGACDGVSVVVNYGMLSTERDVTCVEFSEEEAIAGEVLNFAGIATEGTETYGDQVVCRVNGLPSELEPFVVEGEDPYLETCADMPPAFGYWALWVKDSAESEWAYAEEGIATLPVTPGMTVGLVFSTAGETPVPTDP